MISWIHKPLLNQCFILWTNRRLVFVVYLYFSTMFCYALQRNLWYQNGSTLWLLPTPPDPPSQHSWLAGTYSRTTIITRLIKNNVMNSERFTTARSSRTRCSRLVVVHHGNSQTITFHHLVGKSNRLQQVDQTNEHITFDWFYGLASLQKAEDCRESWTVEVYRDLTPRRVKSLRSGGCWERCFVRLHAPHPANRSLPRSLSV